MVGNECRAADREENSQESLKMLDISEAIHDLDARLTELELALHIDPNA